MATIKKKKSKSPTVMVRGNHDGFIRQRDGRKRSKRKKVDCPETVVKNEAANRVLIKERFEEYRSIIGEDAVYKRGIAYLDLLETTRPLGLKKLTDPPAESKPKKRCGRKAMTGLEARDMRAKNRKDFSVDYNNKKPGQEDLLAVAKILEAIASFLRSY